MTGLIIVLRSYGKRDERSGAERLLGFEILYSCDKAAGVSGDGCCAKVPQ